MTKRASQVPAMATLCGMLSQPVKPDLCTPSPSIGANFRRFLPEQRSSCQKLVSSVHMPQSPQILSVAKQ
jgi:hypothetical protein